ncbi:hypothetical protein EMCRGX_G026628 [Ephydatia muelleri]
MRICYNLNNQVISIDQEKYIEDLLEKFSMHNCKPVATPLIPNSTVNKEEPDISLDQHDVTKFQELIGGLMYLVTCTRPDIAAAVGELARVMSQPSKLHWSAAKHVLRYLKGTKGLSLTYGNARDEERENLIGFSDANFGGDSATARSTTGYAFILNGAAVSWKSKLQSVVALSTAEAEYMALCETVKEAVYLQQLLEEIGLKALPLMKSVALKMKLCSGKLQSEIVNEIPAEEKDDTPNIEDAQVKSDIEEEYLTWQTERKSVEENEICLQSIKIPPILQKRGRPKGHEVTVVGLPSKNENSTKPKPFAKLHTSIKESSRFSLPVVVL